MKDCFGITYDVECMPGNGLCGYSALAYTLTGDKRQYALVIEDLLKAFYAIRRSLPSKPSTRV